MVETMKSWFDIVVLGVVLFLIIDGIWKTSIENRISRIEQEKSEKK
jgi:type III secretory pathway component EscU